MKRLLCLVALCVTSYCASAQTAISNGAALSNGAQLIPPPQALCTIPSQSLPGATVSVLYTATIATSNCTAPLTFAIIAGALPGWVTTVWPNSTGNIQGTPGSGDAGTNPSFTVQVTDANGHAATFPAAFSVATAPSGNTPAPPDPALSSWNTSVAGTPSPNTVVTIGNSGASVCSLSGGTCNYTPSQLATAAANVNCGQTLAMQDTLYPVAGTVTFSHVCDPAHYITVINDPTDSTFPAEGIRVTPCYSGMAFVTGYPAYPCASTGRHMPYIQKTSVGAVINLFGSYYRFQGIEWGRNNSYDNDNGIITMGNSAACSAPDTTCMNAQPTHNIFARNIFHGDAQRQTARAINLGGTRWVAIKDSYFYDFSLTYAGGGGDAQPFSWGNGKNFTNSGWGIFTNDFETASTMGNLFCGGSFTEPLSPSTGFDGIPHDFIFNLDHFYKPITWDTQRGQTQQASLNVEGVNYPPAADQEFIMQPASMQLAVGVPIVVHTWMANDSNAGIDRSPGGTTTLACGGCANPGTQTTVCAGCNAQSNPVGSGNYISQNDYVTTYTAPSTVPPGGTVTLTRTFSTWDGRASTLGNSRTMTASATFTIISGTVPNQISLFPKASDLQIQPSYSDANFNVRQFELEFSSIQNFTSTSLTWKVDGIAGGNSTVGQMCSVTSTTTCVAPGTNDSQAIYWSGTATGPHTISVTSAAGTTDSSIITVSTTAPIVEWDGKANTSKNGFELKCGGKFLVENSLIENDWGSEGNGNGQGGQLALMHPFNQTGCPGNCNSSVLSGGVALGYGPFYIADGTFQNIKGIRHGGGMVVGGSQQTMGIRRVAISNVLCDDCSYAHNSHGFGLNTYFDTQFNGGGTVYSWESATNPMSSYITYSHLTFVGDVPVNSTAKGGVFGISEGTAQSATLPFGYSMKDSFFAANTGVNFYDPNGGATCNLATGSGSNSTEAKGMVPCFTLGGYTLNHLALLDSPTSLSYFSSSPIWKSASSAVGWSYYNPNGAGGDYRLCHAVGDPSPYCTAVSPFAAGQSQDASDGNDLGANIPLLNTVEENVRYGAFTSLSLQTANNSSECSASNFPAYCTSALPDFQTKPANPGAQTVHLTPTGHISQMPICSLLYAGACGQTRVIMAYQPWFPGQATCWTGTPTSAHPCVGYNENTSAVIAQQHTAMLNMGVTDVSPDWYGNSSGQSFINTTVATQAADLAGRCLGTTAASCPMHLMIMVDGGLITSGMSGVSGCPQGSSDETACITTVLDAAYDYIDATYGRQIYYSTDPVSGQPMTLTFITKGSWSGSNWATIWTNVKSHMAGYATPYKVIEEYGSFLDPGIDGAYGWEQSETYSSSNQFCWFGPSCSFDYFNSLYTNGQANPSKITVGLIYPGFDGSNNTYNNDVTARQCGQLPVLEAERLWSTGSGYTHYSTANPLNWLLVATWNDYGEGTNVEGGIDNCYTISASLGGNTLSWSLTASDATYASLSTIDHYTLWYQNSGGQLVRALDYIPWSATSLNLSNYVPTGTNTVYVEMVGKALVLNRMSNGLSYTH